ncbi:hypothetical protein D3C76_1226220 [compost metagenome]
MDQQRQQRLNPHVAQRRHGVAGVGHTLDIQALERSLALALGDHSDSAAAPLLVERQRAVTRAGQQAGQLVHGGQQRQCHRNQADRDDALAPSLFHAVALAHGKVADTRSNDRQQSQGSNQAQQRDQHKAAEHHPDDTAEGIERHHLTDVASYMVAPDAQAQGHGKRRAEQHRGYKHDAQRRHGEACAHAEQFTGAP